jgi:hypothetical protein
VRVAELWMWVESQEVSMRIGESWWFPLFESIHVVAVMFLVGSIVMLDLRLLGLAGRHHPVSRIAKEVVPWTLGAAGLGVVAGLGMFITQATRYMENRAFQIKLALLVLAALNMALFHFRTVRGIGAWDTADVVSPAARLAGGISLLLWVCVTLAGRWTGHL